MSESMKAFNLTIASCNQCPKMGRHRARSGNFKSLDYFCNHDETETLNAGIALYEQNRHGLTTCPVLASIKKNSTSIDDARPKEQQDFEAMIDDAFDFEAIAWAYKKLDAYKVQNASTENAMMMDRLMMILGGYGGAKDGQ